MREMFKKKINLPKKSLTDLLQQKSIVTGKEVIQKIKDKEKQQKEFEESVEFEIRNRRVK
jgi:hypothetical protein